MQKYIVTSFLATVPIGAVLILTDKQSAIRKGNLKQTGKNKYLVTDPCTFKKGEEIAVGGGLTDKKFFEQVAKVTTSEEKKED